MPNRHLFRPRRTVPPLRNRQEIITASPPVQVGAVDRRVAVAGSRWPGRGGGRRASGGGLYIWIAWEWVASMFPALSQDRYCTLAEAVSGNAPAYVGLESVGVVPSVV